MDEDGRERSDAPEADLAVADLAELVALLQGA